MNAFQARHWTPSKNMQMISYDITLQRDERCPSREFGDDMARFGRDVRSELIATKTVLWLILDAGYGPWTLSLERAEDWEDPDWG